MDGPDLRVSEPLREAMADLADPARTLADDRA
jgi:hypothetical protein